MWRWRMRRWGGGCGRNLVGELGRERDDTVAALSFLFFLFLVGGGIGWCGGKKLCL